MLRVVGNYELFIYSVQGVTPATNTGNVVIGGSGFDILIGSSGDDFFSDAEDEIIDNAGLQFAFDNNAPVLNSLGTRVIQPGGVLEFVVSAIDSEDDPLSFRMEQADGFLTPIGASFNMEMREFSWPAPFTTGPETYAVTFFVTDKYGNIDSQIIEIIVSDIEINGSPQSVEEGSEINLSSTLLGVPTGVAPNVVWSVTKNGSPYPVDTPTDLTNFSFTPNDNGIYVVSTTLTVNGLVLGTDSTSIEVNNVAPTAGILNTPETSPEGTQLILDSLVIDPGTVDSFIFSWNVTKDGVVYFDCLRSFSLQMF